MPESKTFNYLMTSPYMFQITCVLSGHVNMFPTYISCCHNALIISGRGKDPSVYIRETKHSLGPSEEGVRVAMACSKPAIAGDVKQTAVAVLDQG